MPRTDGSRRLAARVATTAGLVAILQALVVAAILWAATAGRQAIFVQRETARMCREAADVPIAARAAYVSARNDEDVHRQRFEALFAADGTLVAGNATLLPETSELQDGSVQDIPVLPLYDDDGIPERGLVRLCPMGDGQILLAGFDRGELRMTGVDLAPAIAATVLASILAAIGLGWIAIRRIEGRIASIRDITDGVLRRDFSRRIPRTGRGDVLDGVFADVNRMMDQISELLSDLMAIGREIAHQMKSPLVLGRLRLETLEADTLPPDPRLSEALDLLDAAIGSADAILRLRALSGAGAEIAFAPVDLVALVCDAAEFFRPLAEESGGRIDVDAPASLQMHGDGPLLMEAVMNVLDNAFKHGCRERPVSIRVTDRHDVVSVEIENHFAGLSDLGDRTAIGLRVVQAIAQLHGGHLETAISPGPARPTWIAIILPTGPGTLPSRSRPERAT